MAGVYIISDYGKITKQGGHLIYQNSEGMSKKLLTEKMELLVLKGKVSITGDSFSLLARSGIPVYFMEHEDVPNIMLDFGLGKNGFLRQKQYRISDSKDDSLKISKMIVAGKIRNQITFLRRFERSCGKKLTKQIVAMWGLLKTVERCANKEKLRGLEGVAAKNYFDLFDLNIKPEWAVFGTRSRRPPKTNVNSALSFLYSLLTCRVQSALESQGLDTSCSNLHEMSYGKSSLAYDLVEEFRTPIADRLCCALFNKGIYCAGDFWSEDGAVYMTKEGNSKTIKAFEDKMKEEIWYEPAEENLSYMEIIFEQARAYKKYVQGESDEYVPFLMR